MHTNLRRALAICATVTASAALLAACGGPRPLSSDSVSTQKLTIKRDTYGIPHIYASDTRGLFYGFGYAVAEDRLFQLEMAKRSGNGSVAEVLGRDYAATDMATRSALDPGSIRAQLQALSADDRAMFEGYAAGVNARVKEVLAHKSELMPKQFVDYGFEPTEWSTDDVAMIWIGLILSRFFGASQEVANLALLQQLQAAKGNAVGQQIYGQLRWLEDANAPTIVPRAGASASASIKAKQTTERLALKLAPLSQEAAAAHKALQVARMGEAAADGMPTASNAWVLGPSKTTDGRAVLYNGPQQGFNTPAFVHGIGLHGAGYDLTGVTPIGLLPVLFGTNGTIAWGSTVGSLDTNDMYQERLNPSNEHEYRFNGAYRPMTKRTDVIKVKGEADRRVDVYSTVHGFVQSWDLANGTAYTGKRSWEGREIETMLGWAKAAQSETWDQYMTQAARVSASITWFYADVQGNIGVAGLGSMPNRPATQDIRFPATGDGTMEWQGILPFSQNPKSYNPAQGFLASWNNQIAAGLRADGANFSAVDRVNEINTQLTAKAKFNTDEIWKISEKAASADLNARYFVPYIVAATAGLPATDPVRKAADLLAAWDMQSSDTDRNGSYDNPATTVLRAWLTPMFRMLLADDLPAGVFSAHVALGYAAPVGPSPGSVQPARASKLLLNALQGTKSGVPQPYDFFNGQDPNAMIRAALSEAVGSLTKQFGADMSHWLTPVAKHRFATTNAIGVPWAGMSEQQETSQYLNRGTASYRVILQAGGVSMCSVMPPGQSGFVDPSGKRSKHYDDQLVLFENSGCKADALTRAQVDAALESSKELQY